MFEYKILRSSISFSHEVTEKFYTHNQERLIELEGDQQKNIDLLRSYAESAAAQALATTLATCQPNHRCRSLACAYCIAASKRCFKRRVEAGTLALYERVCVRPVVKPRSRT